ncbi:hypothetical protein [Ilyobacter polytropus]|uniref:Uncharacterized protein n=1 Tax=Ilyobacter polytropus (strain ATCC 51220 / DSM 2926 / LMG 16218 / CuHBu1) TaxID=572544 RepID=E3H751_ILYPC|nr:hypothetical protein [Ilyobacter polytropus]ADO81947.1 hypothetical protein Ilyop_0158 [Ilyobacter polytropus DSM 2926]
MNRKAFILPLVLLILALMSGIAVVLGRLSSEKTLSLKNQERSYYAEEITVILVDEETTDDSSGEDTGDESETEDLIGPKVYTLQLYGKNQGKTTVSIETIFDGVAFEYGDYIVKIVSNSDKLSAVEVDTTSISLENDIFEGPANITAGSKLYLTNKSNALKTIEITVTLTPN